jgi:heme-binding protein
VDHPPTNALLQRARVPPPCTAAELARVMSGEPFDTSNLLSTHPDVNNFFTRLKGEPHHQVQDQVQSYLDANPQVRDELQAIRQPRSTSGTDVGFRTP